MRKHEFATIESYQSGRSSRADSGRRNRDGQLLERPGLSDAMLKAIGQFRKSENLPP